MGGIVAWEQAKAVVVLGGENNPLAAGGLDSLHPLIRIDLFGVKLAGRFFAGAPFAVGKGIHAIVNEGVVFQLRIGKLAHRRNNLRQPLHLEAAVGVTIVVV